MTNSMNGIIQFIDCYVWQHTKLMHGHIVMISDSDYINGHIMILMVLRKVV